MSIAALLTERLANGDLRYSRDDLVVLAPLLFGLTTPQQVPPAFADVLREGLARLALSPDDDDDTLRQRVEAAFVVQPRARELWLRIVAVSQQP